MPDSSVAQRSPRRLCASMLLVGGRAAILTDGPARPIVIDPEQGSLHLDSDQVAALALHLARLEEAGKEAAAFRGALNAQDANMRARLDALGLFDRFGSLAHLADDMGEALLSAEADRDTLRAIGSELLALKDAKDAHERAGLPGEPEGYSEAKPRLWETLRAALGTGEGASNAS